MNFCTTCTLQHEGKEHAHIIVVTKRATVFEMNKGGDAINHKDGVIAPESLLHEFWIVGFQTNDLEKSENNKNLLVHDF